MGKQTRDAHAGRLNVGDQDVEDGMVGHLPAGSEDTPHRSLGARDLDVPVVHAAGGTGPSDLDDQSKRLP
jgi:hypothetical protein